MLRNTHRTLPEVSVVLLFLYRIHQPEHLKAMFLVFSDLTPCRIPFTASPFVMLSIFMAGLVRDSLARGLHGRICRGLLGILSTGLLIVSSVYAHRRNVSQKICVTNNLFFYFIGNIYLITTGIYFFWIGYWGIQSQICN